LDSRDGSTIWQQQFPGAFVHAAAIYKPTSGQRDPVIVAPCQDGRIYALDWGGRVVWQLRADRPFVTPAKIAKGIAYVGSLDERTYAVDVQSGQLKWRYDAGGAIRQPAAIANGRVLFGSENMIFHAVEAETGKPIWRTGKGQMTGQSFRNTWPVVVGDKVMTFQILVDGHAEFVMEALLFNATPGDHTQKRLEDWPAERKAILDWLAGDMTWAVDCNKSWQENPGTIREDTRSIHHAGGPLRKTFYVFNVEGDGNGNSIEPYQVPMGVVGGTGNSNMGPVIDAQGRPITWWRVSARSIITGGGFGTAFSPDLNALDLKTGDRIILPTERDIHRSGAGMELDNHHMLTAAGDYVYYHNPFRQARWVKLDGRRNPYGAISAAYRFFDGGGWRADVVYYPTPEEVGPRAKRIYYTHGAARTPIVIADDALFVNEVDIRALACYETRSNGPAPPRSEKASQPKKAVSDLQENPTPPPMDRDLAEYVWQRRRIANIADEAKSLEIRPMNGFVVPPSGGLEARSCAENRLKAGLRTAVRLIYASTLKRWLTEHVEEMVDAGHLLPYYAKRGENRARWYFTNPGDTVAALARAYPYVAEDLRPRLAAYLKSELSEYPPWSDRLNRPGDVGTSRMDFQVPDYRWDWREPLYRGLPRVHNVYTVWLYVDATGDEALVRHNWDKIRGLYERHRPDTMVYVGGASAPIGLARLARLVGDEATKTAALGDASKALHALQDLDAIQAPMAARYGFGGRWPGPFVYAGFHLLHLTPETARYIREHPQAYKHVVDKTAAAIDHWPMWFVSQASAFTRYYGESHALPPTYSAMIFPVKALVERANPGQLRIWVDAEDAPRGDLFFIERLVLAIEALGEERWVDG